MIGSGSSKDRTLLSFVDVLSCGLGAAVLLFLVYSALPHHVDGDPEGGRGMKGQSFAPRNAVGSVVRRPGTGNTVSMRFVEIEGPANSLAGLGLRWSGVRICVGPGCCEDFRGSDGSRASFILVCPGGFGPDPIKLRADTASTERFTVRASAIDGTDRVDGPEVKSCRLVDGELVVFDLDKRRRPIEVCVAGSSP